MKEVLFVCRGNTCRSPMAQAIFEALLRSRGVRDVAVRSAGIWAVDGQPATAEAQKVMRERGLDLSRHRARHLRRQDVERAAIVLAMERAIAEAIAIEWPDLAAKVHSLAELADDPRDVEDPIGGTLEDYRATAETLQVLLQRAYGRIMAALLPGSQQE
jgi:protein-tyrosine-phosphatase